MSRFRERPTRTVTRTRRQPCRIIAWFQRLTMRTKLLFAFFSLILTSATATVVIALLVFGRQISGLAVSEMEVGLNVAEHSLRRQLVRAQDLAKQEAREPRRALVDGTPLRPCPGRGDVVDFFMDLDAESALVTHLNGEPGQAALAVGAARLRTRPCRQLAFPRAALEGSGFTALVGHVKRTGGASAGFYVLSRATMDAMGLGGKEPEGLFLAAAAQRVDGSVVLTGASLHNRRDVLDEALRVLRTKHRRWYEASIFLRGVRVVTTLRQGSIGTRVDQNVLREVLERGRRYVGSARVIDEKFYTAYMPLPNHAGTPVGILGIGARRQMYVDMRNATTAVFAALIAVGVLFGFLVTYLSTNWIISPLSSLAMGMDRVARGDLDHKVRIESEDELGRLVKSFNLMVKNIKEREIRLQQISEERLSTMEKQVSIGRLAAGVAHEINNPLTSVLSLSMLMQQAAAPDDPHAEDLAVIVEETTRCRNIVRGLLDFARQSPMEERLVDINQVIQETLALATRYEAMEGIQIELHLAPMPLRVLGDSKRLQQVFTNVITNAADAAGERGLIIITTDEDSSGGYVVAKITDNGKGIPPELMDRVFEPFYTTKGSGGGTGLGLAVSLGIIREHRGVIDLVSREGEGVTVTIQIPRVEE